MADAFLDIDDKLLMETAERTKEDQIKKLAPLESEKLVSIDAAPDDDKSKKTPLVSKSRNEELKERLALQIPVKGKVEESPRSPYVDSASPIAPADIGHFIKSHSLFSSASDDFITDLVKRMHYRHFVPGDLIVRQGEIGKAMFFIVKGIVTVSSKDGESIFADLGPGKFFGEIGVLFEVPRTANVVAKTRCFLAVLTMSEVNDIMQFYPEIADEIRLEAEERFADLLKKGKVSPQSPLSAASFDKPPSFQLFSDRVLDWLSKNAQVRSYPPSTLIIKKGDIGLEMFVVKSGSLHANREDNRVMAAFTQPGTFFGEAALVLKIPRTRNVVTTADTELYILDCEKLDALVAAFPEVKAQVDRTARRTQRLAATKVSTEKSSPRPTSADMPEPLSSILSPDIVENQQSYDFGAAQLSKRNSPSESAMNKPLERGHTFPGESSQSSSVLSRSHSERSSAFYLQTAAPLVTSASASQRNLASITARSTSALSSSPKAVSELLLNKSVTGMYSSYDSLHAQYSPTASSADLRLDQRSKSSFSLATESSDKSAGSSKSNSSQQLLSPAEVEEPSSPLSAKPIVASDSDSEIEPNSHGVSSATTTIAQSVSALESITEHPGSDEEMKDGTEEEISDSGSDSGSSSGSDDMIVEEVVENMRKPPMNRALAQNIALDPKKRRASIAVWADSRLSELAAQSANKGNIRRVQTITSAPIRFAAEISDSGLSHRLGSELSQTSLLDANPLMNAKILEHVFKHVPFSNLWQARAVCGLWFTTAQASMTKVDLSEFHGKNIDDQVIGSIAKFVGDTLEILVLKNCWKVTSTALRELASYNHNLEVLDLSGCWEISDEGLTSLSLGCRKIRSIDLSNCRKVTDSGLSNLMGTCQNLMDIYLSYCKALSDNTLTYASNLCHNLRRMNLQRCLGITDAGYSIFSQIKHFKLQELILSDCSFLTDNAMKDIADSCPNLRHLNISFCCALSDSAIELLTSGCTRMKAFDASFCGSAVSDASLSLMAERWKDLERLSVRGCIRVGDDGVLALVKGGAQLSVLNISNCKNISENVLKQIPSSWKLLNAQTPLLDFSGITGAEALGSGHIRRFTAP